MIDEIKLRLIRKKPTLDDFVRSDMGHNAETVFRVTMSRANRDQEKMLKKAATL